MHDRDIHASVPDSRPERQRSPSPEQAGGPQRVSRMPRSASSAQPQAASPTVDDDAPQLAIIGCGNANRRDDGLGPAVIHMLRQALADDPPPRLLLADAGTDGMAVMFRARGCRRLIIIDAARSGSEPGSIYEVPGEELAQPPPATSINLHDFRWDHALHAGRRIFGDAFPADVRVFLVEVADTGFGLELSPPVRQAAETLVGRLLQQIKQQLQGTMPSADGAIRTTPDAASDANDASADAAAAIHLRNGRLYVPACVHARHFKGLSGVVLLQDGDDLCILPVHRREAGGHLLKQRNAAGDRVIDAIDFFRQLQLDTVQRGCRDFIWDEQWAALRLPGLCAPLSDV